MTRHNNSGLKKVCACSRRNWARCRHPWHFSFQWKGERHRLSLDRHVGRPLSTKAEAQEEADNVRTLIRAGNFPPPPPGPAPPLQTADVRTLDTYADTFIEGYSKRRGKKTWRDDGLSTDAGCQLFVTRRHSVWCAVYRRYHRGRH